jgi:hypothetical protein
MILDPVPERHPALLADVEYPWYPIERPEMTNSCIHGFPADQCASCRTCPHGLTAGRCGRCVSAANTRRAPTTVAAKPSEEHRGFEIYYVPEVSGWHYRDAEARASELSYRSAFLARKAVDEIASRPAKSRS